MLWTWGVGFILADIIIAAALIALLSCREPGVPKRLEWLFPLRGRWVWYLLIALVVGAYLGLAPLFLGLWIQNFRR